MLERDVAETFEKGPLRWLLGLTFGEHKVPTQIRSLTRPGLRAGNALERLGVDVSKAVGDIVDPPESLQAQVAVLGHVMASANAGRQLARTGHVRAADSQLRAMVEGFALMQCLDKDDARARRWQAAVTLSERRRFEFSQLKKCSQAANDIQPLWDSLNEYVHANSTALPAHSRRRSTFGYDIPVGPMFDPLPVALTIGLVNAVEFMVIEWVYANLLPRPIARLGRRLTSIGPRITAAGDAMKNQARTLRIDVADGIPVVDQRKAVAHMSRRARRAGRGDVARWIVARAKSHE